MSQNKRDDLIETLISQFADIREERTVELNRLAKAIHDMCHTKGDYSLIFICTHNSRRSQLAELWMRVACAYYELSNISCYSGGTEATAFNIRMVRALSRAGFHMKKMEGDENPFYHGSLDHLGSDQAMFSKKYDDPFNPTKSFMAVMVCSHADQNCPFVPGADHRVSLPYRDPKAFDDTEGEEQAYDEKVLEIGREILYLASAITRIDHK